MKNFKEWLIFSERYEFLRIDPEEILEKSPKQTAFFYDEDHQLIYGSGRHEHLCNRMSQEKLAKYGVEYCDDDREKIEKYALAGRVGTVEPYLLYPALANIRFRNLAKQGNLKDKHGNWDDYSLKKDYQKKIANHYRLQPDQINAWQNPEAYSHIQPQKDKFSNYMSDPTLPGNQGSVENWPEFEKNKGLLDKYLISFWNKNEEIYSTLLKPCLLELQNKNIISKNIEDNFVSLPHEGIQPMSYYLKGVTNAPAPLSASDVTAEEEQAAIHTGNLRGRHLSTDERNALRAKYGREIPDQLPSPEQNYQKWKTRQGD